ncbi:hypothetical protein PIB30_028539 [Stylosanthes scabra]|uniref:Uncharacterized protein n=1 Tax=Stylosanthes scabra TaxID=79078 RepID=A0ABU6SBT3_9FABA|nr:hypothetical protein [Stylosanthes scabra]
MKQKLHSPIGEHTDRYPFYPMLGQQLHLDEATTTGKLLTAKRRESMTEQGRRNKASRKISGAPDQQTVALRHWDRVRIN